MDIEQAIKTALAHFANRTNDGIHLHSTRTMMLSIPVAVIRNVNEMAILSGIASEYPEYLPIQSEGKHRRKNTRRAASWASPGNFSCAREQLYPYIS